MSTPPVDGNPKGDLPDEDDDDFDVDAALERAARALRTGADARDLSVGRNKPVAKSVVTAESTAAKPAPKRRSTDVPNPRRRVKILLSALVTLVSFFLCLHLAVITGGANVVITNGKEWSDAGDAIHDRAVAGMSIAFISFVAIVISAFVGRRNEEQVATFTVSFSMVSMMAMFIVLSTYQQYVGFLHG